jgi:hypothetical protein
LNGNLKLLYENKDVKYLFGVYCQIRKEMETAGCGADQRKNMDNIRRSIHDFLAVYLVKNGKVKDFMRGREEIILLYKKIYDEISVPENCSYYLENNIFTILLK